MPDIRDTLKGLDIDHRAIYTEARTTMRRAYLSAHAKILPIDKYDQNDDKFLDFIDISIAMLFDRAGVFDHSTGMLADSKPLEQSIQASAGTAQLKNGWPTA